MANGVTVEDMIRELNTECCSLIEAMRANNADVRDVVKSANNRIHILSEARDYIRNAEQNTRDEFAMHALNGLLIGFMTGKLTNVKLHNESGVLDEPTLAASAYAIADACMDARDALDKPETRT